MPEFALLLLLLWGIASVVWHSRRTGISPMPSSRKAFLTMCKTLETAPKGAIVDAGSGWGTVAVSLARRYPERRIIGYELSPLPWLVSVALKQLFRLDNLTLLRRDFRQMELKEVSVVVCYLFPQGMRSLASKLHNEPGFNGLLVSNTFALPGYTPKQTIQLDDLYKTPIYLYRFADKDSSAS